MCGSGERIDEPTTRGPLFKNLLNWDSDLLVQRRCRAIRSDDDAFMDVPYRCTVQPVVERRVLKFVYLVCRGGRLYTRDPRLRV